MNRLTDNHNKGRLLAWINLTIGATLCAHSRPITTPHSICTSGSGCDAYIQRPCSTATRSSRKTWLVNLISTWVEKITCDKWYEPTSHYCEYALPYGRRECQNIKFKSANVSYETLGHGRRLKNLLPIIYHAVLVVSRSWWQKVHARLFNICTGLYIFFLNYIECFSFDVGFVVKS